MSKVRVDDDIPEYDNLCVQILNRHKKQSNMYNKRTWLNKPDSPSTGNVVAFDGVTAWKGGNVRNTFLSISDCNNSIRLHKIDDDSTEDFIDKMKLLRDDIEHFIGCLETTITKK